MNDLGPCNTVRDKPHFRKANKIGSWSLLYKCSSEHNGNNKKKTVTKWFRKFKKEKKNLSWGVLSLFLQKGIFLKIVPFFAGDYVWTSFVKVSNGGESCIIEGPCRDAIVWFLLPLSRYFGLDGLSVSLSLTLFVQFWYADRLTLKRSSHGDKKGPLMSPGTRQTPIQRLHATLKS